MDVSISVFCTKYLGDLLYWRSNMWLDLASVRSSNCVAVNRGSPSQLGQSRLPLCFIYGSDSQPGVRVTQGVPKNYGFALLNLYIRKINIIKKVILIYNNKKNDYKSQEVFQFFRKNIAYIMCAKSIHSSVRCNLNICLKMLNYLLQKKRIKINSYFTLYIHIHRSSGIIL